MFTVLIALLLVVSPGLTQVSENETNLDKEVETILQCLE